MNIKEKSKAIFLNPWSLRIVLIALVVFLAYFQTLFMYFWNDDNAIIFKLQHLNEGVGNLGSGIFGLDSPYRMVIFPLIPVYYLFGINATAFFAYGIFFYFLAACSVFIFANSVFRDRNKALITGLIFASGAIGAESLWRVYNSVHTSITIIYIMFFCAFYFYSTYEKKLSRILLFYSLALIFYVVAIQWGYVRAHGIILIALAIELLFNFNWRYSLFRALPFIYLFRHWYGTSTQGSHHLKTLQAKIFTDYDFSLLLTPLKTLSNTFFPDFLNIPIILFVALLLFLIIKFRSRILFFSLVYIFSGYLTYFVIYHDLVLNTTHRYLTTALPGLALLITYVLSKIIKSEKRLFLLSGLYVIFNLLILNWMHLNILVDRSFPTRNFYQQLTQDTKALDKNSIIHFDVENTLKSKQQFESFFGVGSMPDTTAIAIYFNLDRYDLSLPLTFGEFVNQLRDQKTKPEQIKSFFYSSKTGLVNTTGEMQKIFSNSSPVVDVTNLDNVNYNPSAPFALNFRANPVINEGQINNQKTVDINNYLKYLKSKADYYKIAEATSSTDWKYQEVRYINDNNTDTGWMANRVSWHYLSKDEVIVDLKSKKMIGAIKMDFGPTDKAPTKYEISCMNGGSWKLINTFYHSPRNHGEQKIDKFQASECQKIKIALFDTPRKDAPVINELEVIDSEFADLNFKKAEQIEENPAEYMTAENLQSFKELFTQLGVPVNVCIRTNKDPDEVCKKINVNLNTGQSYSLQFNPQGTLLTEISFQNQANLVLNQTDVSLKTLSINEVVIQ